MKLQIIGCSLYMALLFLVNIPDGWRSSVRHMLIGLAGWLVGLSLWKVIEYRQTHKHK